MAMYMNLHPKETYNLGYSKAKWLYDMGMHDTLALKDHYDWAGEIFDKSNKFKDVLGAPLSEGPKI